eukprot:GHVP01013294.1.p1 GENE.GHVP01013294.1~~GHVP01013294.1.p1  ORF type:complete len:1152 (-),score=172.30 GHVP01013294.1:16-3471(-)
MRTSMFRYESKYIFEMALNRDKYKKVKKTKQDINKTEKTIAEVIIYGLEKTQNAYFESCEYIQAFFNLLDEITKYESTCSLLLILLKSTDCRCGECVKKLFQLLLDNIVFCNQPFTSTFHIAMEFYNRINVYYKKEKFYTYGVNKGIFDNNIPPKRDEKPNWYTYKTIEDLLCYQLQDSNAIEIDLILSYLSTSKLASLDAIAALSRNWKIRNLPYNIKIDDKYQSLCLDLLNLNPNHTLSNLVRFMPRICYLLVPFIFLNPLTEQENVFWCFFESFFENDKETACGLLEITLERVGVSRIKNCTILVKVAEYFSSKNKHITEFLVECYLESGLYRREIQGTKHRNIFDIDDHKQVTTFENLLRKTNKYRSAEEPLTMLLVRSLYEKKYNIRDSLSKWAESKSLDLLMSDLQEDDFLILSKNKKEKEDQSLHENQIRPYIDKITTLGNKNEDFNLLSKAIRLAGELEVEERIIYLYDQGVVFLKKGNIECSTFFAILCRNSEHENGRIASNLLEAKIEHQKGNSEKTLRFLKEIDEDRPSSYYWKSRLLYELGKVSFEINDDTFGNILTKYLDLVAKLSYNNKDFEFFAKINFLIGTIAEKHYKGVGEIEQPSQTGITKNQEKYLIVSIKSLLTCLRLSDKYNVYIFKVIELWFSNFDCSILEKTIEEGVKAIKSSKLVSVISQLISKMETCISGSLIGFCSNNSSTLLEKMVTRISTEHPHHTIPYLLLMKKCKKTSISSEILTNLRKNKSIGNILDETENVFNAYSLIGKIKTNGRKRNEEFYLDKDSALLKLKNLKYMHIPTCPLEVDETYNYKTIITIKRFEEKGIVLKGKTMPIVIFCIGSDGNKYAQIIKRTDDLRIDSVVEQVYRVTNEILFQETGKRLRTYKVIPLDKEVGLLEWVPNTVTFDSYVSEAHMRINKEDLTPNDCLSLMTNIMNKNGGKEEKLRAYKKIIENFNPVFRHFFWDNFSSIEKWAMARVRYTESTAMNSMIGYIIGLGDRHCSNILIDKKTGEAIHVDLNMIFETGKGLKVPETVPFRLTRDIIDGMGMTGIEGSFRDTCEQTLSVLRKNKSLVIAIMSVLKDEVVYNKNSEKVGIYMEEKIQDVRERLSGIIEDTILGIPGQVNYLIRRAMSQERLSMMYPGWKAWF